MLIPIRCFSCNKVLADKWDYYQRRVEELAKEAKLPTPHFDAVHTGEILNELGLSRYCCRRHMISNVELIHLI